MGGSHLDTYSRILYINMDLQRLVQDTYSGDGQDVMSCEITFWCRNCGITFYIIEIVVSESIRQ